MRCEEAGRGEARGRLRVRVKKDGGEDGEGEQAKGGGCCFKISMDECVSLLWGGGPSALYVCHSTRLCLASRERQRALSR